jgi:hypothetical protein
VTTERERALSTALQHSIYNRLAGYDDTNDTDRLCVDLVMQPLLIPTFTVISIPRDFYEISLIGNTILHSNIEHLMTRPLCRPPKKPIVLYHSFRYQAAGWDIPRRVAAKIEWYAGELFPKIGFIVTNLRWKSSNADKFYSKRGTAEK